MLCDKAAACAEIQIEGKDRTDRFVNEQKVNTERKEAASAGELRPDIETDMPVLRIITKKFKRF